MARGWVITVSHAVLMANGYVDIGTWNRITPYVGVGVGYALHRVSGLHDFGGVASFAPGQFGISGLGYAPSNTSGSFAWAFMAGLGYSVNPNLKLELGYRYLDLGTTTAAKITCQTQPAITCPFEVQQYKLASHDFSLGMRWMFGASGSTTTHYAASAPVAYSASGSYVAPAGAAYSSGSSYSSGAAYGSGAGYGARASYASGGAYVEPISAAPPRRRAVAPRKPVKPRAAPMSTLDAPPAGELRDF